MRHPRIDSGISQSAQSTPALVRDVLGLQGVPGEAILDLLAEARAFRLQPQQFQDVGHGQSVGLLFFEDSTRTRCSFELATARLGAHPVVVQASGSSIAKGETTIDTAATIEAMGVGAIVARTRAAGAPAGLAARTEIPIINAGDGRHEHPTQALLDFFVMQETFETFPGKRIAIVGDIANSRVARSNIHGLCALGAQVQLVGPSTLVSDSMCGIVRGCESQISVAHDFDEVLGGADGPPDAVMMLRIQHERDAGCGLSSDYRRFYGLTADRAEKLPASTLILHPGPVNRGVELDGCVLEKHPGSRVLEQVAAGLWIRAVVLKRALTN
jgi:aspartate carbamoyltransferase catalytic subunit